MANTYNARASVILETLFTAGQLGQIKPQLTFNKGLLQGTGDWQHNKIFVQEGSVTSGAPVTLNLTDGSLKDPAGVANVFTKVLWFAMLNEDAAIALTIGGSASQPWESWISAGATCPLGPEAVMVHSSKSGFAVGTGTADKLKIAAASGTVVYAIALLGQG